MFLKSDDAHREFLLPVIARTCDCRRIAGGDEADLPDDNHSRARSHCPCHCEVPTMAYLLPRAVLVVLAWGMTCGLIGKFCHDADPMTFGVVGASWIVVAAAYFSYLHKLRRDIEKLERARGYTADRRAS
jgi:hypothetical protein